MRRLLVNMIMASGLLRKLAIMHALYSKFQQKKVVNTLLEVLFLFYVFKEGNAEYVRIDAGYPYDTNKYIKVRIDNTNYQFFGEDDSAWSMKDDSIIVDAMKAGKSMSVVGYSKKGTETTDTYTLIGFTKAYNLLQQDC